MSERRAGLPGVPPVVEPRLVFPRSPEDEVEAFLTREWIVTNGLGGYASGTLLGVPTRRYHGIFVPNLPAPRGRTVLVPHLEDEVETPGGSWALSGLETDGGIEKSVAGSLREFRYVWQAPGWVFECDGRVLERTVLMPYARNTTYVVYRLVSGGSLRLRVRPYVAFRGHDHPLATPPEWPFRFIEAGGRIEVAPFEGAPSLRLAIRPERGAFVLERRQRAGVRYRLEARQGYDSAADLISLGAFEVPLEAGESVAFLASTEQWETLDFDPEPILQAERQRLEKTLAQAPELASTAAGALMVGAADQFIVQPASRLHETILAEAAGETVRTVIAGYHWFTDWGRDTMISLEGLTLCTGQRQIAREILHTFSHYIQDGLLPNHFPEGENLAIYNTVDATLWYFHAIERYLRYTDDRTLLDELWPILQEIIRRHVGGTLFGIHVDPDDGLLAAGADGYALTWMDARMGDWVVTPRRGKPVEVQALWYNALRLMERWAGARGADGVHYGELADRARDSFAARFWNASRACLYDVIDGPRGDDPSLRPNQVFAISLKHPILAEPLWRPVIDIVTDRLLTPVGLRTLDPDDPEFQPRYDGDLRARDGAYHQGTVWPWLIGHYLDARQRARPSEPDDTGVIEGLIAHLRGTGVGTVSEIFDALEPYTPRGCIAQAWSVAELIRAARSARPRSGAKE